jgi:hypothetical protein
MLHSAQWPDLGLLGAHHPQLDGSRRHVLLLFRDNRLPWCQALVEALLDRIANLSGAFTILFGDGS